MLVIKSGLEQAGTSPGVAGLGKAAVVTSLKGASQAEAQSGAQQLLSVLGAWEEGEELNQLRCSRSPCRPFPFISGTVSPAQTRAWVWLSPGECRRRTSLCPTGKVP